MGAKITKKCSQKVSKKSVNKKCPKKVFTKSFHKKCPQKVFTKSFYKKCPEKAEGERKVSGRGAEGEQQDKGR